MTDVMGFVLFLLWFVYLHRVHYPILSALMSLLTFFLILLQVYPILLTSLRHIFFVYP